MHLAKDKHGRIGRKVPGVGFDAKVETAPQAERRSSVFVSPFTIENDEKYWKNVESKKIAKQEAQAAKEFVKRQAEEVKKQKVSQSLEKHQAAAKFDATQDIMLQYFQKSLKLGETQKAINALSPAHLPANPADFSASGGNVQYVRGERMTGGTEWRADFRDRLIVGNPLTRDGVYGPAVTDYDRIVQGVDVNQTNVVQASLPIAGGTMLGRYEGENVTPGMGSLPEGMGIDLSSIGKSISTGVQSGVQKLTTQIPQRVEQFVSSELQKLIEKGMARIQPDGKVVVYQEQPPVIQSQIMGLPPWAIYAGVGVVGIGLLLALSRR